ncbi:hypothetical protein TNCV_840321 [Trichonephila clavipes]|nr:hypothetical protein TNCV_840321 [Trichonephila clavipes]
MCISTSTRRIFCATRTRTPDSPASRSLGSAKILKKWDIFEFCYAGFDPQAPWSGQVDLCHERPRFSSVTTGRLLGPGGRRVETDAPPLTQPTPTSPPPTSCSTPHANQPPPTRYYDPPGVYARTHATHARWKTTGTWDLDSNPGEDMDVCKCIVPLRHGGTRKSRRAANPLVRLVEGEERLEALELLRVLSL